MMWNVRKSKRDGSLKLTTTTIEAPKLNNLKGCLQREGDNTRSAGSSSTSSKRSNSSRQSSVSSSSSKASTISGLNSVDIMSTQQSDAVHDEMNDSAQVSGKVVRFKNVEVRDYERIVSDNPCCSSGPPIGIGWAHGEVSVVDVDSFERRRNGQRVAAEMVLTRHERENLLTRWGARPEEVAKAIRHNVKVKNQRRQTVRNLGKATIEEKLETAKEKLKRALLMKRRTDKELRALQRQALLAAQMFATVQLLPESSTDVDDEALTCSENGMSQSLDASTLPAEEEEEEDDERSRMSGLTLSNSTTASMREMENFYRELELDLFGDEELPYMVGQTIECSGASVVSDDTSNEHKANHEKRDVEPSFPVDTKGLASMSLQDHHPQDYVAYPALQTRVMSWPAHPPAMDARNFEPERMSEECRFVQPHHFPNYQEHHSNYQQQHSSYQQQRPTSSSYEPQHQPYRSVALPPGYYSLPYQNNFHQPAMQTNRSRYVDPQPSSHHLPNEPRICHVPLPDYTSPTRWMEGVDSNIRERKVHCFEAVTITEAVEDLDRSDWDRY